MAQTIKLKRSATAGAEPTPSQLELGEVAINTYDGKMYIKKSVAGTESIVEISGGDSGTGIIDEFLYTATAGQTAFSGNDDNSDFLSYVTGAIQVFLNGILLDPETDYTATNGALLTLTSAASANDYLQIFSFKKKISDGNVTVDSFSGNNSTTAFTLSIDPGDENNTRVFVDGVYQSKANYTVSGTTLTFSTAPPSGTAIEVESGNRGVTLPTTENLDFPDNVKLRLGTSQDLEIYHDASDSLINDNGTGSLKLQTGGSTKLEVTSTGVDVTGNIAVSGTVDGIDIAARDGVLTSTTTTAGAALPRTGGAMTGAITTNSTFDGRDVATDGAKLDGIEAGATADQTQSEINALGITATGLSGTPAISVANITTTGELRGPASFTIDPAAVGDNTGTVIIKGNLQVDGATTTINSTTLTVDDLNLTLASGAANGTAANGAGITIDGASATLTYASAGDNWAFNKNVDVTGNVTADGLTVNGTGSIVALSDNAVFNVNVSGGTSKTSTINQRAKSSNGANADTSIVVTGSSGEAVSSWDFKLDTANGALTKAMSIDGSGDVSFYEDTGTTPKFFWDASAESLGIGAGTNPTSKLQVEGSMGTTPLVLMKSLDTTSNDGAVLKLDASGRGSGIVDIDIFGVHNYDGGVFHIRNNGFVGIGTDSPDALLHISATSPHIDIGPQGGNRGKIGYHSNDVIIGSTSSTGNIIFKNNISSTDAPQTSGDVKMTIADVGLTIHSDTYNILNLQTDSNNDQTSTDGIIKITNNDGSSDVTKAEFRWDESEDLVHVSYGDHGRHVSINSTGKVGIGTGSTSPTETLDVAGTALVENAKLKAIAESNTDTAVDVFVYDTRKDSDGGAWRKRTQNTSWYNETLNTSTRGARKEFPCVAVIVAEATQLTIYDGDDPDMPMWMVFNSSGSNGVAMLGRSIETTTSIAMLNGILSVGRTSFGLHIVHFISDFAEFKEAGYDTPYALPIGTNRNSGNSWVTVNRGNDLVNDTINDVAMTVLPNAPIDADTGLPVPTIAVATNGGVSVIKDNGSVVDITSTSYSSANQINFTKENQLSFYNAPHYSLAIQDIPTSDETGLGDMYSNSEFRYSSYDVVGSPNLVGDAAAGGALCHTHTPDYGVSTGSASGLTSIQRVPAVPARGLTNYITSDYNTGWMNGDIKLATLSDTDTTNAASTDLLGGIGNFSDANAWTVPSGWSLSSNIATGSAVTAYLLPASNGILTTGKQYAVTVTQSSYTSGTVYVYMGTGAPSGYYTNLPTTTGTYTFILTAYNSNFGIYGANYTGVIDNVTVSLAEQDRSVNRKGLQVFGTVTKTAVATGAELMAYSGFSTSNYLEHSFITNYGSPAVFSFMGWQKTSNTSDYQYMGSLIDGTSQVVLGMSINATGVSSVGKPYFYDSVNSSLDATIRVDDGQWHFMVGVFDGTSKKLYIDGKLNASATVTALAMTNVYKTQVGFYKSYTSSARQYFHLGSIALIRTSATAPSAEQIKKMYNDEKHLFQENAKATLYGSSDAVTALAYDDDTELLHVGTSAGRSVFQGLNRVDNTTDAVGTAISASNGFIVED